MGGRVDGWMGGCKSRFKDCLQQSKMFLFFRDVLKNIFFFYSKISANNAIS
jgi:hypothetical protein